MADAALLITSYEILTHAALTARALMRVCDKNVLASYCPAGGTGAGISSE
jgi:hypothetical protein